MAAKPVSFRIPSKYVVFLDALAADQGGDRTKVLVQILDRCLQAYLSGQSVR
jgi:hypothetical protein